VSSSPIGVELSTVFRGWLVLEVWLSISPIQSVAINLILGSFGSSQPWITPSLFDATNNPDVVDEWTFCEYVALVPFLLVAL